MRLPGAGESSVFWQGVASTLASVLASDCEPLSWVAARSRRLAARRAERWRAAWERLGFLL